MALASSSVGKRQHISERGAVKNHKFQGIERAWRILNEMGDNVVVYFDPDVDGIISGYLVCKFLKMVGKSFSYYINSDRNHNWSIPFESLKGMDVIAVDFMITPMEVMEVCDAGCNLVSMDHHINTHELITYESGKTGKKAVIINNQNDDEDEDGRYLSGAGVVFESIIGMFPKFDTLLNRQLVGITLLSDIRDIENELAEGYLYRLYSGKYDGLLRYLIDSTLGETDYGFGLPRFDRNYVDYKFSPAVNAMLRFNQQESVIRWILGDKESMDLHYRDRQKSLVRQIKSKLNVVELENLRVCYFNEWEIDCSEKSVLGNFVGYVASDNMTRDGVTKSVICYMIGVKGKGQKYIVRASFRGRINGLDYNLAISNSMNEIEEFSGVRCLGHGSAFGIKGMTPSGKFFKRVDKVCGGLDENSDYMPNIIDVRNMSMFVNGGKALNVAEDNMYKLSQNKKLVKYTGLGVRVRNRGANFIMYEIDGVPVMCFDVKRDLEDPSEDIILEPSLERERVYFYVV